MEPNENQEEEIVPSTKFNLQTFNENFRIVHKKTFPDNTIFSMYYLNDGSDYALGFKELDMNCYNEILIREKIVHFKSGTMRVCN